MIRRRTALLIFLTASALAGSLPAAQAAAPAWQIEINSHPTNFAPNSTNGGLDEPMQGLPMYTVSFANVGPVSTDGTSYSIEVTLPPGVTEAKTGLQTAVRGPGDVLEGGGSAGTKFVTVEAGELLAVSVPVNVSALAEGSTGVAQATISGGGAGDASASTTTTISSSPPPFGILSGGLAFSDPDGGAITQAGAHPTQMTLSAGFPAVATGLTSGQGELAVAGGGLRDLRFVLPKGAIVDPRATSVRCTEAQLEDINQGCPDAAQVGIAYVITSVFGNDAVTPAPAALYNMVPPPGTAAKFGFNVASVGIFVHATGGVSEGEYRLTSDTNDILARVANPVLGAKVALWGNPSATSHDHLRGECLQGSTQSCAVAPQTTPLISMPTACCPSLSLGIKADSWSNPSDVHTASFPATDPHGDPTPVTGCGALGFTPTLSARPTTEAADSPSGLNVDLHIPQTNDVGSLATAHLRKAVVTLPAGIALNPASANGLQGCSSAQIGIDPNTGVANGNQPTCPDASRIGNVEVDTPLLPEALQGSVYVAIPNDNPFNSLLAIYVVVNDPQTGTLIKLSGHVEADPNTGQLTTTFDNNPQLPFEDFKLNFFGGPGGVLRTPSVCGNYSTTSQLTPWSAPDSGPPATPHDDYALTANCSSSEASAPNSPEFEAGTVSPIAGKYTPFNIHLSRKDGTQQFKTLTLTPPPGLTAKLAGIPACSDAALASAASKSGTQEQQSPSCPSNSQIGTVTVGAGAGPAPYYAKGKAYLSGPYKGAPLSMAIITPAVAGPYDLGTVVTRVALHVDPATTQITADADPVPSILQGIPLDVRSVDVSLDKPNFSRTGTSCDPFSVDGQLVSTIGQSASLKSRYQLGNCANLAFKPKLAIRLKGGTKRTQNPVLIATLTAREGEANIASTAVTLPRSAFLDQSHIKTVCTRVQFAAGAGNGTECPAGSIYGTASAKSPLLDYTLSGNAYLRSSSHKLPDLVIALHGPPSQPIAIELDGRTDSVKGALRNSFEAVPDAPVSSFRLELFGGKRGLVVNSRNLCAKAYRASVSFGGQNGAVTSATPKVKAQCPKSAHKRHKKRHGHR